MYRPRERHNAKARQSTTDSHKKKSERNKSSASDSVEVPELDVNAEVITPKTQEQKELDRKEKLKQELIAQSESKVNSKKKKRLEKYIEKKLKQEERVLLFEKLSKTQAQIPSALNLQSSSTLGTGYVKTHQERLDRDEDKEVRYAMDGRNQKGKGKRKRGNQVFNSGATDESDVDDGMKVIPEDAERDEELGSEGEDYEGRTRSNPVVLVDSGFSTSEVTSQQKITKIEVGSALQRNADGTVVGPRISKRKSKGTQSVFASWKDKRRAQREIEESDTSFDSSDSAYDTNDDKDEGGSQGESESEGSGSSGSASPSHSEKEDSEEVIPSEPTKHRRLGFKEWALNQLSVAKGYVAPIKDNSPLNTPPEEANLPPTKKRKVDPSMLSEVRGPLGEDIFLPSSAFATQIRRSSKDSGYTKRFISIQRPQEVEDTRLLLPIVAEEQPIMEAILLNSVVIICGETGSGKTTQVPQFLYEAGFGSPGSDNPGMIGITQPRRVAAMSMASRVAQELSLTSSKVSYQIRYDATVSPETSIKFMTDGVLLRELSIDFLLKKYSVIIIDEAHERSMNTDILIGVLSRVIKLREQMWTEKKNIKPLRLIIMSATLRVSDFAENRTLFTNPPPIINVPARQHPVTVHFSRRTSSDYVVEAVRKASKIHARLPPGGILIFLTGQNEISGVCRKLEAKYSMRAIEERKKRRRIVRPEHEEKGSEAATPTTIDPTHVDVEAEDLDLGIEHDLALDVDGEVANADVDMDALESDGDSDTNEELGIDQEESETPMHIVPLYALLPSDKQMRVFQPPPQGSRLVVVSTNVAETSLTIPGIRYVVDCGRAKERRYDVTSGIQTFQVSWISKASAAQRAGRAGRTGPGHCYRLYSSALYENYFDKFSQPEILRMPIEGVVLQMKSMHIDAVTNFPFPTPPDRTNLRKAEVTLTHLGALKTSSVVPTGQVEITEIGRAMSLFPLSPRFSRMLVSSRQHGCLPYVITMVSALSVGDPFLREETLVEDEEQQESEEPEELVHLTSQVVKEKELRKLRRRAFFDAQELHSSLGSHSSDVFRILSVVGAYEYSSGGHQFCADHFVRPKAMEEIHKLRAQISSIVQANFPDLSTGFIRNLQPPTTLQLKALKQLITAGFIDQVAIRKDKVEKDGLSGRQYTTSRSVPYKAVGIVEDVFIHPSSVLANLPPPEYVVFLEVVRTSRVWIKGVTVVHPAWLSSLGPSLCTFSKPAKTKSGEFVIIPHFGPAGWELPPIKKAHTT